MDKLSKAFIILAALAIPVVIYHAYDEITNYSGLGSGFCNVNHVISCATVFDSGHTTFLGLSLWVYGAVWFPLMLFLGFWFTRKGGSIRAEILVPLLMVGNVFTIYLWYLELGVIHAICPVCVSLYCFNYALTALGIVALLRD